MILLNTLSKKIADCVPFGWIRYESGAEKCADRLSRIGDRLPDGLREGENERKARFWEPEVRSLLSENGVKKGRELHPPVCNTPVPDNFLPSINAVMKKNPTPFPRRPPSTR
jgi:hypothetical protein